MIWSKGGSIAIVAILILSGLFILGGSSRNASATASTIYSDAAIDGYLLNNSATGITVDTSSIFLYVGQNPPLVTWRSYVSFDTSGIPLGAIVSSATLSMWQSVDGDSTPFSVHVYRSEFVSVDISDWSYYSGFEGTMPRAGTFTWNSLSLNPDYINKTGPSGYCLKSSTDDVMSAFSDYVAYSSGDVGSAHAPRLDIVYSISGTTIHLELTGGTDLVAGAYPQISEWNLTYDLYRFDVDTVPLTENITIDKASSSWTLKGMTPACAFTETSTYIKLTSVYTNITYRIWLTAPKVSPYCTVHISLYNQFTGEGYFWEQMRVEMCDGGTWNNSTAQSITAPDFYVEPNATYTLRILDFFGNVLTEYAFAANSANIYLSIPVPYYSWQIFNMNDAPVLMRIYWNNSGSPWEFFVGPTWIMERFLKGGNYTFMVTFYNTDGTVGSTVYYTQTIPLTGLNASFVYVNGTGLSQIISSIEGVMALQTIITNLVSPSVVVRYENLPLAPVVLRSLSFSGGIVIDPYEILQATTYQNKTGAAGVNATLWLPTPSTVGATYIIDSDTLTFGGTHVSTIYINQTDGTNLYYNTVLPAVVNLQGQNVTVWCTAAFSVTRATTWREVSEYTINYYPSQKMYATTLTLNDSTSFDYFSPYWYIAFPANTSISSDSVVLYDLDNGLYLSQRTNFDVSAGGIHLTLARLNSTMQRNFRLTFFDLNSTSGIGAPNLIAEAYSDSTLNGIPMKCTSVQWVNPWSVDYKGEVYITLNYSGGDNLKRNSITIIDQTTGTSIPQTDWIYTGRTLIILTDGVGTVPVGGARNYAVYFTFDSGGTTSKKQDAFFGPITWGQNQLYVAGYAVSWFIVILILMAVVTAWLWYEDKEYTFMLIMTVGIGVVGVYLSRFMSGG